MSTYKTLHEFGMDEIIIEKSTFIGYAKPIKTEEEVLSKIDKIKMEDVDYVLKTCFGAGIINSAYVGSNINQKKLDEIIYKDTVAFNNGIIEV